MIMFEEESTKEESSPSSTRRNTLKLAAGTAIGSTLASTSVTAQAVGTQRWYYQTETVSSSSPTVVNGTAFIGTRSGDLHAVDMSSGDEQWVYRTGGEIALSSPNVVNNIVFIGSLDNNIYALDATDGSKKWIFETDNGIQSSPTAVNDTVYAGSRDGNLYSIDTKTGTQNWAFDTGGDINSSPTVVSGTIYIGNESSEIAIDADSGEEVWRFEADDNVQSSATVIDGIVYFATATDKKAVYALDATTGEKKWEYEIDGRQPLISTPTVANGTVFIHGRDRNLSLYALDALSGEVQWTFEAAGTASSPTVADNTVYSVSGIGLKAINATTGEQKWQLNGDEYSFSSASSPIVVDGTLLVGTNRGVLSLNTGINISSNGSRVSLGTLGHTEDWALKATVDSTITLNNVNSSAWEVSAIEGNTASAPLDQNNPRLLLDTNSRYLIKNNGWSTHPLEIRSAEGTPLLSQDNNTIGNFEDDSSVNWVDNGNKIVFTLTETLSSEMNNYVCTVHTNAMAGSLSSPVDLRNVTLDDNTIASDGSTHSLSFDVFNLSPDGDPDKFTIQIPEEVNIDSINNIEADDVDIIEEPDASNPLRFEVDPASPIEDPVSMTVNLTLSSSDE